MPEDKVHKEQGGRLKAARIAAGYRSARDAALSNGWPESTYRAHELGSRTIGQDDAERYARRFKAAGASITAQEILFGEDRRSGKREAETAGQVETPEPRSSTVPIMGYIGAGAEIEPDFEQVPEDGIEQVAVPFPISDDLIGFKIRGTSMAPLYEEDGIILVQREQPWATDQMIGLNSAVRTHDGRRYLKRIAHGGKPHTFNLESLDGRTRTIANARIAWASPVRIIIPNIGLRFIMRKALRRKNPAKGG